MSITTCSEPENKSDKTNTLMQDLDSQARSYVEVADLIVSLLIAFRQSTTGILEWGVRFGKDVSAFLSVFEQTAREPKGAPIASMRNCCADKILFDRVIRFLRQDGFIEVDDFEIVRRANPYAYLRDEMLPAATSGEYRHALLWPRYTVADCAESVCHLVAKNLEGEYGASAFFVGDQYLVTAFHCIQGAKAISLDPYGQFKLPTSLSDWKIDEEGDLAITQIPGNEVPRGLRLASTDAKVLDEIVTLGFPKISLRQPALIAIRGNVISGPLRDYSGTSTGSFLISTASAGGHSGGPVLSRDGKVVAMILESRKSENINVAGDREFSLFYEAVPASRIGALLRT